MDDATLAGLLATDLDGSFETLVRTYQDRIYAFGLRLTGSPRDAEEIAQDAFVRAYRALSRYPGERIATLRVRAWLFQIALNVARNRGRGGRLRETPLAPTTDEAPAIEPVDDPRHGPEATVERDEARDELAHLVAALPERYRLAVVLRHVEGLRYHEIAAVLGQPVGTAKSNVHRGVALLRRALAAPAPAAAKLSGGVR
ncbi:MAG: sigma-70 family RNA polymerase sigma factor [Chloroflexota bacterium]|nr:sigma-70 family RNA polymerase sigma factor [Chloroflexota bacterium]